MQIKIISEIREDEWICACTHVCTHTFNRYMPYNHSLNNNGIYIYIYYTGAQSFLSPNDIVAFVLPYSLTLYSHVCGDAVSTNPLHRQS